MGTSLSNAGTGAAEGAAAGSAFGPWGTVIGGAVGGIAGYFTGGGNPNAAGANPMAGMSQEAWQYYMQNIVPQQQRTFQQLFSPNALAQAQTQAKSEVDTQFTNAGAAFTREAQSLGIVPSASLTAAQNKTMALNQGMAEASAENQATAAVSAQRNKYLGI